MLKVQYYDPGDILSSNPIINGYIIVSGAIKKLYQSFHVKSKLKTILNTWSRAKAIDETIVLEGDIVGNTCDLTNVKQPTGSLVSLEKSTVIVIPTADIIRMLSVNK
jgi:hypothetical protein